MSRVLRSRQEAQDQGDHVGRGRTSSTVRRTPIWRSRLARQELRTVVGPAEARRGALEESLDAEADRAGLASAKPPSSETNQANARPGSNAWTVE